MENPLAQDLDHVLEHTRNLWNDLRGEQIFITGGTGFFGHWLLESFVWINNRLKLDCKATVLSRSPEDFRTRNSHLAGNENINLVKGDIRTFDFPEGTFSHIIHAATETSMRLNIENPLLMLDTIVSGTRRVLDFSMVCKAKKLLLTSSGAVYGRQPTDMASIPEDYYCAPNPTEPVSAYGEGKRMAELLCSIYAHKQGIETKIARCFAFVGPYLPLNAHYAIGNFIHDAIQGGPIRIGGDGTPFRSYLYSSDLTIWLWTILFKAPSCRPYNVGSSNALSICEIANVVKDELLPNGKIQIGKKADPEFPSERYIPSTQKAEKELGLKETIGLSNAIKKTGLFEIVRKKSF